ncbi:MAG: ribosome small subunit-dependent GTPase A [Chitinispirillales bacterium]|jgi:ribosome biogenesis GTPase|nr:ribosome small subunit-dependent GTPase A [Chitinispirillales bacterium]
MPELTLDGVVVEEQKNYYMVSTQKNDLRCTVKGALLKKRNFRISAGDAVRVQIINEDTAEGVICETKERTSFLPRPPLANLSQVVFVNCFKHPSLDTEAIDRFLFSSTAYGIEAVIVFNKRDLLNDGEAAELEAVECHYRNIGYKTLHTSVPKKQGISELIDQCRGKTSAFTGLSGVGKSSLLSLIFPHVEFKTNLVSGARGRGTHTTTHIKLWALNKETFIADTPGFAFVDVPTVDEETVVEHFPEIKDVTGQCRFNNCIHDAEPGCKVAELVDSGVIASWRQKHYLKIYREMLMRRKRMYV